MAPHPYLDHNGPIAFAHRGGTSSAPENSMRAFEHAYSLGYRYLETDVHATADGVLVAFHDNDLERTCGIKKSIATSTWAELQDARIDDTDPIPTLMDIMDTWPDARLNIDCKSPEALQPLIDTIRNTQCFDRVCIGSFSDKRLQAVRKEFGAKICTSMGPKEVAQLLARATTRVTPFSSPALAAQIPVRQGPIPVTTQRLVDTAHRLGIAVHVWTIDDPVEIARLLDLGVDGIMSDDTMALRDVFTARGHW
jgi:glycerophosphoryl diester phosphodiesterase